MATLSTHTTRHLTLIESIASGTSPDRHEQLRIDRLLELRAVIDSLRSEHDHPESEPAAGHHCLQT